jgi:hypothetical protein
MLASDWRPGENCGSKFSNQIVDHVRTRNSQLMDPQLFLELEPDPHLLKKLCADPHDNICNVAS